VTIRVTDGAFHTADAAVTVNPATAVQISPSTTTLSAHGSVTFSASGGSGVYTWSTTGAGTLALSTYNATWSAETPTVTVTDTNTLDSAVATITVNPPAVLVINPSSASINDNGSVTFTASGGSGNPLNYSYAWQSGIGGPPNVVGSIYTPSLGVPGVAVIRATDAATLQTRDSTVTVSVPTVLTISPKTITVDAHGTVNFAAGGGALPYNYAKLSGAGTLVGSTYTAPWSATTAVIQVTDNASATDNATVTVNAPPALVISPSTATLNVGQNVTFTGSGGSGTYTYSKISGLGNLVGATYTAPGTGTIAVIQLRDTLTLQTRNATVTVSAPPALTFTPVSTNVVAGTAVTFTPGGGSGSYTCSLVSGTGTLVPATYTYTTISSETSVIRLLDTITLLTKDATVLAYDPLIITPNSVSVAEGTTYPFSASGGIPPYTYTRTAGTGTINPSTGLFTAPFVVETDTVKVTDSIANFSTASVTVPAPGPWNIVSIDASAKSGQYASLALDGSGLPRIAYYEAQAKELRLATWTGSSWSVQTVDSSTNNIGQYCSLALAPGTGYPRISYYDAHNHDLRYASWNGSSWALQTVASSNDVGKYTSLALQPGTGYPRISYYDETNDNLKYASWNGSSWSTQTVDSPGSVGLNTSLALQPGTSNPRISYYDKTNKRLRFASWNGTAWVYKTVDSTGDVGLYSSLALDSGGNPRISYYDNTNKRLKYAWSIDGGVTWPPAQIKIVDNAGDVGMHNSLALESGGNPRISYYDNTNKDLKYAWSNDGGATWPPAQIELVDSANQVGSYSSLKLDPAIPYKPRIGYYDSSAQDLKYAAKP
jgi:hypothetical protein